MIAGTFLSDPSFVCKDGTVQNKIVVLLSDGQSGTYVVVKTTSKGTRHGVNFGCQVLERFPNFFLPRGSCFLHENTWIQLDAYHDFAAYELEVKIIDGSIHQIGRLERHLDELLICAINTVDISAYQEQLVRAALKAHRQD